jgi:hypothetical protein
MKMALNQFQELKKVLDNHERRILALEGKGEKRVFTGEKKWYKPGSTIERILSLLNEGFFNTPHTIAQIIEEFKTKDYHPTPSDLTLPLRRIVRKGLLKRTRTNSDGSSSKKLMYIKA